MGSSSLRSRGVLIGLRVAAVVVAATGASELLAQALPELDPVFVFLAAVALAAWLDGIVAGLLGGAIALGIWALLFRPPAFTLETVAIPVVAAVSAAVALGLAGRAFRRRFGDEAVDVFPPSPLLLTAPKRDPEAERAIALAEEISVALRTRLEGRESELAALHTRLEATESELAALRGRLENRESELVSLRSGLEARESELASLRTTLLAEREQFTGQQRVAVVELTRARAEAAQQEERAAAALQAVREERDREASLRQQAEQREAALQTRLQERESELRGALDGGGLRLEEVSRALEGDIVRREQEHAAELAELRARSAAAMEVLQQDLLRVERELEDATTSMARERAERDEAEQAARAQLVDQALRFSELTNERDREVSRRSEVEAEARRVIENLTSELAAGRLALEGEAARRMVIEEEAKQREDELRAELARVRQAAEDESAVRTSAEARAKRREDELASEVSRLRRALEVESASRVEIEAGAQRRIEELTAEIARAGAALDGERQHRERLDAALRSAIEEQQHQASEARAAIEKERELRIGESQTMRLAAERELAVSRTALDKLRETSEMMEAMLRSEIERRDAALVEERSAGEAARARITELEDGLSRATSAMGGKRIAADEAWARIEKMVGEVASLRSDLTEMHRSRQALRAETDQLRAEAERLRHALQQEQAARANEATAFDEKLQSIVNHMALDHESDVGKAVEEREAAKAEVRSFSLKIGQMQRRFEEERQALVLRIREAEERCSRLTEEIEALRSAPPATTER